MSARVLLVGAGPGDPDLLTVRALRALEQAEIVLYDALVDPRVVALARAAICLPVGKRAGKPSMDQRAIEAVLIRAAHTGRAVVRLKCGDPFVFGRGGEEALALVAAGIEFEVVPGISSAIAGPGAAGIPVTHRGLARGFAVLTAQPEEGWQGVVEGLAPRSLTLVFLMALAARPKISARLLARGWAGTTPAAIVLGAHSARQWSWTGTLAELSETYIPEDRADLPGLLVIGDVVAVAEQLTVPVAKEIHLATA